MTANTLSFAQAPPVSRPDELGQLSPRVQRAALCLHHFIEGLQSPQSTSVIKAMAAPLHQSECDLLLPRNKTALKKAPLLCQKLLTPVPYKAWWAAPAAAERSHHAYPGGWLLHTSTNLHALEMLVRTAEEVRGLKTESNDLYAGMILHDILKPRLLLWDSSGSLDDYQGECGHHVAAIAEAFLQGASERVLVMLAGVHSGWWHNRDTVAGYLQRAAELIGSASLDRLATSPDVRWELLYETELMYQAERAWYSSTRSALQQIKAPLKALLSSFAFITQEQQQAAYWWVLLHCGEVELAHHLAKSEEAFTETIRKVLLPDSQ